jgi:ADP-ribose pyrophosphatase
MGKPEHKIVWEGKYLRVRVCGTWEYAERPNSPAGIVILAVTPEGKLLLTEQYRVPMQKNVIELPAGLAGDEHYGGEELVEAARRELREETGYEAGEWEQLIGGPTSAGLSNEVVIFFRGRHLRKVCSGGGAGDEKIQTHEVAVSQVPEWLREKERRGVAVDPRIYTGLYFLLYEKVESRR